MADQGTVQVSNVSGRLVTLTLAGKHLSSVPRGTPGAYKPVKLVTVHHAKDGKLVPRVRKVSMPDSIRIPAGETVDVPEAVTHCAAFRSAVDSKTIRVIPPAKPGPVAAEEKKPAPTKIDAKPSTDSK